MTKLSEAKTLGGVGSILVLLTPVPSVGWILGIIGLVLTLIAIKYISDFVEDKEIFTNMLISIVLSIVSVVVAGILLVGGLFAFFGIQNFSGIGTGTPPNINQGNIGGLLLAIIPGLLAFWIMMMVSAFFLRKSFHGVSVRLNVSMFDTAALIYLIGAITSVILIGFLLIFVAEILFVVSFFSINESSYTKKPVQAT